MLRPEPMTLFARILAALVVIAATAPSLARAEIAVTITGFASRDDVPTLNQLGDLNNGQPIGIAECLAEAAIEFNFSNIDTTRTNLEIWRGNGCNVADTRNDTVSDNCTQLDFVESIGGQAQIIIEIEADVFFDCSQESDQTPNIWVLALSDTSDDANGAGQSAEFPLAADLEPPDPPTFTDESGGTFPALAGETSVPLAWETDETDLRVDGFDVLTDGAACDNAGEVVGDIDPTLTPTVTTSSTNADVPLADIELNEYLGVAVRQIDSAGNVGELTAVRCVQKLRITGFPEEFCRENPDHPVCLGEGCSVSTTGAPDGGWPFLLLALGWAIRRRVTR